MIPLDHDHLIFGALALRPNGSGVQTYQRELIRALSRIRELPPLAAVVQEDAAGELPDSVLPLAHTPSSGARRAFQGLLPVRRAMLFHGLDVDLPIAQRCPTVSTVHDMSAFDTPWAMSRVRARGEQLLLRRSIRRADVIISVSHFTAERVKALLGRESTVTPLAPAPWARVPSEEAVAAVREKYRLPERFVLQLGTLEPRKKPEVVNAALEGSGIPLVLAGGRTDGPDRPAGSLGLGYVDLADIPALYRAAHVVAYASSYEGFGLPPVEAMACGAAVVASAVGGIPEAVGKGAVVVSGLDPKVWREALMSLLEDSPARAELRRCAAERVGWLNWQATALATARVYRELL
ncbi:D-inositol 3-phosphate glycosyltransferase [Corynebacterium occultum]|uniref:D-inositol 3-phosphate glycosyltransferase n=1 Tax=Corynebacterium occultum TaxID=2675219 RepID=A0A6B8W796_9CORY|nr:glycosyltransferase family 1 protein [Corynebacterium occultum]QGU08521.1 D-inositol 3-phosphate glycosyltransferase [Corynebacterium occultum]